jgi:hypothetical protein
MKPEFRSLKLEDVKELRELVSDAVASIEPGLRLLENQVTLGSSTIDLVTLDAEEVLTLVAVGFEADDEMMLRALEAYSWCQDSPDEVVQRFPVLRPSTPPRVIFIAERIPQGFLRKMRHLRFSRVDCLEFRFGLQFAQVEDVREADASGESPAARSRATAYPPRVEPAPPPIAAPVREVPMAEPPPAPPVPVAPPQIAPPHSAASPGRHHSRSETAAPRQTHRPRPEAPRREEPAPPPPTVVPIEESRAATGGHAAALVSEDMVRTVREYLQREFPTAVIYDFYAHDRGVQMFHLQDSHGAVIHSASVSEEVLGDGAESQLKNLLEKHKLARVLRQAGSAAVAVTKAGLKIERR